MISFYIQKKGITNKILFENEIRDNKKGLFVRLTNKEYKRKYYFIDNEIFYNDVLFFGRNRIKIRLKELLKNLGFKVIPNTSKNNNLSLSYEFLDLNLIKWDDYKGLF